MAITFFPKAGMVLICDFKGNIEPEINKVRPVVIISPNHINRPGLVTVVPLSTTPPEPIEPYHYRLIGNPIPGKGDVEVWAKCDLVASVCVDRLDRIKVSRGNYQRGTVSMEQVRAIRLAVLRSMGIDPSDPSTYS